MRLGFKPGRRRDFLILGLVGGREISQDVVGVEFKAFDIDDTLFVRMAAQIERDPLHPLAFDMVWDERESTQPKRRP